MYSNLESDERKRDEVVSCLYWSLMQNWNIPRSIQDCYGFTEDYRLFHRLEEMSPDEYRQKRLTGEVPDSLEVDARLTHRAEALFERLCPRPPADYLDKLNGELERLGYRELDVRFVRMTGRRPYADEFFSSLRRETEKAAKENRPKQVHRTILRNPPSKGRKMSF